MHTSRGGTACLLALLVAILGAGSAARAQQGPAVVTPSKSTERLAAVGRLWGEIRYFHPWLAYRRIAWDSAFVATYPRLRAAGSPAEFAAAVQQMLDVLGDPATRLLVERPATPAAATDAPLMRWLADSTLVLSFAALGDLRDDMTVFARLDSLGKAADLSRALILDLRGTRPAFDPTTEADVATYFGVSWARPAFQRHLVAAPLELPTKRARMYSGLPPERGETSGGYFSAFLSIDAGAVLPLPGARARPIAVVVDERSSVPDVIVGLKAAGRAVLVAERGPSDGAPSAAWSRFSTRVVDLTDGVRVAVRTLEPMVVEDLLTADTTLDRSQEPRAALDVAAALLGGGAARPAITPVEQHPAPPAFEHDLPPLDSSAYPSAGSRVLAAYRFWNAIHFFYPYKHLMGEDWVAALPDAISRLEQAADSAAYVVALSSLVRRIHDSHGGFWNPVVAQVVGAGLPPVRLRMIEDRPVVTALLDSSARLAGFRVGDEVLQVDGQDAARRRATMFLPRSYSTPQAEADGQARAFLRGPLGSEATVVVRNADGRSRTLRVKRVANSPAWDERPDPVFRLLSDRVGYADLTRLQVPQVDSMFEAFKDTRAIIFDMRGYPNGTAWAIAPRLADRPGKAAARFRRPLRLSADTLEGASAEFVQTIPASDGKPRYTGRTVMLIDERAVSQAEHTGLFFEAANNTIFVGSPTAGANGDVTWVVVPGGLTITLTGHDVRHADGRQLQRVGLQPHVPVRPTIKGVRAGRDEVLEAALAYLKAAAN